MTSEKAVKSSSSGEVFQKAMLSLSSDVAKECRGKQKRKERLPKPKSTGQKATASRRQKNHLTQAKTKTQMMNRENDKGSATGKATKSGVAEKLNLLRNPKVVSSEPITNAKRKVLGTIQSSRVGSGLKPGSASTAAKVNTDLRRVLATSEEEKANATSTSDSKSKRNKKGSTCESSNEGTRQKGNKNGSKQSQASKPSPIESVSDMDSSPRTASVPLREISLRLVEGLQTRVIFPEVNYLDNVKAELKKLMKQSDPEAYAQLMLCISDKHEDTPAINAAILAAQQDPTTDSIGSFNILQSSGYLDDSSSPPAHSNPLQTLFDSAPDSIPPDPTATAHATLQPSTSGQHYNAASLLPPVMHQVSTAAVNNPITHLNVSPTPFHLPTVILHCDPDIKPSTADNMLSQQHPPLNMDNSHMSFSSISVAPPPSVDFLDYLDAGSLDSASDVQYNVAITTGPGDEEYGGGNPTNHWMSVSPERPRMFPRKLY